MSGSELHSLTQYVLLDVLNHTKCTGVLKSLESLLTKYECCPALIRIRAEPQQRPPPPGFATSFAFFFLTQILRPTNWSSGK